MTIFNLPLKERICPCCKSNNFENLWSYAHTTATQNKRWLFEVHNVICKHCGFVCTSPVIDPEILLDYYADSFSKFTEQAPDYDIEKRLNIVKRYSLEGNETFLEIGANKQSEFHIALKKIFKSVVTIEPILDAESDYKSIQQASSVKVDVLAHYFVLEHVPNVIEFMTECSMLLKNNGIMICEIPSLELYKNYSAPLILFEHVNHFTPAALAKIAGQIGFEFIFQSSNDCSRPYGFVAVFQKKEKRKINSNLNSEYEQNKSFFNDGLKHSQLLFNNLNKGWKVINDLKSQNKKVIVWAANETTNRLFSEKNIPDNVIIVDSDIRKKNYFGSQAKVFTPPEVEELIIDINYIIICTHLHAEPILEFLKTKFKKTFKSENIYIIDTI